MNSHGILMTSPSTPMKPYRIPYDILIFLSSVMFVTIFLWFPWLFPHFLPPNFARTWFCRAVPPKGPGAANDAFLNTPRAPWTMPLLTHGHGYHRILRDFTRQQMEKMGIKIGRIRNGLSMVNHTIHGSNMVI